jgi:hypothetical protein
MRERQQFQQRYLRLDHSQIQQLLANLTETCKSQMEHTYMNSMVTQLAQ